MALNWEDFTPIYEPSVKWEDFEPIELPAAKVADSDLAQETPYLTEAERDAQLSTIKPRAPERPASEGVMWDGKSEQHRRNERLQEVGFAQAAREARAAQDQATVGPLIGAAPTEGKPARRRGRQAPRRRPP